eukprot:gb/GECH01012042.1/.p1 GENE.gb/GECH01012042.1/~~gb/GECH01012042.1/.p1  ORF type:complete len:244 (+),score=41.67 gb/GECH01012042.1/:1-732(+)
MKDLTHSTTRGESVQHEVLFVPNSTPSQYPQFKSKPRKGVRIACAECKRRHKACSLERPCKRCRENGTEEQCVEQSPSKKQTIKLKNNDRKPNKLFYNPSKPKMRQSSCFATFYSKTWRFHHLSKNEGIWHSEESQGLPAPAKLSNTKAPLYQEFRANNRKTKQQQIIQTKHSNSPCVLKIETAKPTGNKSKSVSTRNRNSFSSKEFHFYNDTILSTNPSSSQSTKSKPSKIEDKMSISAILN